MTRRFVVAAVALVAVATALAAIAATQGGASKRSSLARLSNEGRTVTLQHGVIVREAHLQRASLLAVRGRLAVYRLEGRTSTCFGTGDSNARSDRSSVRTARFRPRAGRSSTFRSTKGRRTAPESCPFTGSRASLPTVSRSWNSSGPTGAWR